MAENGPVRMDEDQPGCAGRDRTHWRLLDGPSAIGRRLRRIRSTHLLLEPLQRPEGSKGKGVPDVGTPRHFRLNARYKQGPLGEAPELRPYLGRPFDQPLFD